MQKFLSKYGLASHLALLAALPLALTPFLPAAGLVSVTFWLSALAAVAFLVEPSVHAGEHLSQARARVRGACLRDPFFWFLVVALVYAGVEALNTGIALRYDAEQAVWLVSEPSLGGGPASAEGAGAPLFAATVALALVAMGIRHGMGLMARIVFGLLGACVAGLGGFAAVACACAGLAPFAGWMRHGFAEAPFWPSLFGVWFIVCIVSAAQAAARKWKAARLPLVIGLGGNLAALLFFAPPLVAVAWLALAVPVFAFSLVAVSHGGSGGAVARTAVFALFGFALAAFLLMTFMPAEIRASKVEALNPEVAFPEARAETGEALSRIAREAWRANPWFGVGEGAFGVHVPFLAEKADWVVLPPRPTFAFNGYWTLLAERGIVGCLLPALGLGLLLATYVLRLIGALGAQSRKGESDRFLFAVPPVAWCAPFAVVLLAVEAVWSPVFRAEGLLGTALVALALAAAAFPRAKAADAVKSSEN